MANLAHLLLAACALHLAVARAPPPIPVAVILDEPEIKADEIPRPLVDLENPGPPQRQEHETQNPETYLEQAAKLFSVKENIERTQDLLRQGFEGVSDDIQTWISNSDQLSLLQQNIRNLRDSFTNQIQKLNETLQGFVQPPASPPAEPSTANSQIKQDFQKIESRLQILEDNFKSGVNTLSEGVHLVASLQSSEGLRQSASASPEAPNPPAAPANPPQNMLVQYVDMLQTSASHGLGNVTQAIGHFFTNNPAVTGMQYLLNRTQSTATPVAPLADTPEGGTQRPPFPWQNWQNFGTTLTSNINNFFNGLFPSNPLASLWQGGPAAAQPAAGSAAAQPAGGSSAAQPAGGAAAAAAAAQPAAAAAAAGSNSVPEKVPASEPVHETQAVEPAPATLPPPPIGPIRQILNNIPVVQRIQSQIQAASSNTDKPRDTVKSENVEKGGILLVGKPPHNNNSGEFIFITKY